MRSSILTVISLLTIGCVADHKEPISNIATDATPAVLEVVIRQGPERLWHHLGDELLIIQGSDVLLRIKLAQASDYEVPLTLTLSPQGRILYWAEYFDNPQLPSGQTTQKLFRCDGKLVQEFKTVLFASFRFANGNSAIITLSLPQEGMEWWYLNKVDDRNATLNRTIDPCYVDLLKKRGLSGSAAMNCILDCALYSKNGEVNYRQFQVNLPWPILNPPGTGFRPEDK
jgi:hypothetical protein